MPPDLLEGRTRCVITAVSVTSVQWHGGRSIARESWTIGVPCCVPRMNIATVGAAGLGSGCSSYFGLALSPKWSAKLSKRHKGSPLRP